MALLIHQLVFRTTTSHGCPTGLRPVINKYDGSKYPALNHCGNVSFTHSCIYSQVRSFQVPQMVQRQHGLLTPIVQRRTSRARGSRRWAMWALTERWMYYATLLTVQLVTKSFIRTTCQQTAELQDMQTFESFLGGYVSSLYQGFRFRWQLSLEISRALAGWSGLKGKSHHRILSSFLSMVTSTSPSTS